MADTNRCRHTAGTVAHSTQGHSLIPTCAHAHTHTAERFHFTSRTESGRREGATARGSNSAEERSKADLRQSVLRTEDRTKWQRAQPSSKSYRTEDGLLHCHPYPHPRYKRAGSPRGSLCSGET